LLFLNVSRQFAENKCICLLLGDGIGNDHDATNSVGHLGNRLLYFYTDMEKELMNNDYFNDLVDEYESIFGKLTVSEVTKGLYKMFHDQMFIIEQMESIADSCKDDNTKMLLSSFAKTNRPTSDQFSDITLISNFLDKLVDIMEHIKNDNGE
jgi:hypothetical protein